MRFALRDPDAAAAGTSRRRRRRRLRASKRARAARRELGYGGPAAAWRPRRSGGRHC